MPDTQKAKQASPSRKPAPSAGHQSPTVESSGAIFGGNPLAESPFLWAGSQLRPLGAPQVLQLQRTVGNRATARALAAQGAVGNQHGQVNAGLIQRKSPQERLEDTTARMAEIDPAEAELAQAYISSLNDEQRKKLASELKKTKAEKGVDKRSQRAKMLWQAVLAHYETQPLPPLPNSIAELRAVLNNPSVFLRLRKQLIGRFNEKSQPRGQFLQQAPELQLGSWTGAQKCGVAVYFLGRQVSEWPGAPHLQHYQALEGSGLMVSNHWHSRLTLGGQEVLVDSTWKQFFYTQALFGPDKVPPHQQAALRRIFFADSRFPPVFVGTLQELINTARLLSQALKDANLPEIPREFIIDRVTTFWGMAKLQNPPDPGGPLGES